MTTLPRSTVVGVFGDRAEAEQAIGQLRSAGFQTDQIGFAMREEKEEEQDRMPMVVETKAFGTIVGGVTGTIAGGVLGGLLGAVATVILPGIGPALTAGVIGMVLGGAYVGGIVGVLVGMDVPETEARYYEEEFEAGRALVVVKAQERYSEALAILGENGALDVTRRASERVGSI